MFTIILIGFEYYFRFLLIDIAEYSTLVIIFTIALSLICKSLIFNNDSSLWFGFSLIMCDAILVCQSLDALKETNWWIFTMVPACASLICFVAFENSIQLRLFIFESSISIILSMYYFGFINLNFMLGMLALVLIMIILYIRYILYNKYKRKGNGKI